MKEEKNRGLSEYEKRLTEVLSKVEGVGHVEVMITEKESKELPTRISVFSFASNSSSSEISANSFSFFTAADSESSSFPCLEASVARLLSKSASNDTDVKNDGSKETSTPGEAVLASTTLETGFFSTAKLTREQNRAKQKEILMDLIADESVNDEQKQAAIDEVIAMTANAEKENAAELLLEAKGFEGAVVNIVDVHFYNIKFTVNIFKKDALFIDFLRTPFHILFIHRICCSGDTLAESYSKSFETEETMKRDSVQEKSDLGKIGEVKVKILSISPSFCSIF